MGSVKRTVARVVSGASLDLQPDGGVYTIRCGAVVDAAGARAVMERLKAAFAHFQANPPMEPFFEHRIEAANVVAEGLPLDEAALHPDFRSGEFSHAYIVPSLQPGWFWLHVAALPGGPEVIRDWLAFVTDACVEAAKRYRDLWESSEGIALGGSAALPLALHDPAWLPDYAALLTHWDLGHEVHELTAIQQMFDTHGWSSAMADLLIARVAADGQHHTQHVFRDLRPALQETLSEQDFTTFYRSALGAFRESNTNWLNWPPDQNACRTFDIDGPLLEIARTLPANTVEKR